MRRPNRMPGSAGIETLVGTAQAYDMNERIITNIGDAEGQTDALSMGYTRSHTIYKIERDTAINAKAVGPVIIYSVPSDEILHLLAVIVTCTNGPGDGNPHTASIGGNASDYNDWLAATQTALYSSNTEQTWFAPATAVPTYAGGTDIYYNITVGATSSVRTIAVALFGWLEPVD